MHVFQFTETGPNGHLGLTVRWGLDQLQSNPEPGHAPTRASQTEDCIVPEVTTIWETV